MKTKPDYKDQIRLYFDTCFITHDCDVFWKIMAENLHFRGPLFRCHNFQDYINSLKADPPGSCQYELMQLVQEGDEVVALFDYISETRKTPMK